MNSLIEEKKTSQELIIKLLEKKGLYRIHALMTSSDSSKLRFYLLILVIRKLAAKLLIELAFSNEKA